MNPRRKLTSTFLTLTAALLLLPHDLRAQDDDAPVERATVARPKPVIELGAPFADNAVLQREMEVPVWGWGKPGTIMTVAFAGQTQIAEVGKDGKWMLKLKPLKADATPQEMVVTDCDGKVVTIKNILVGEVWMASGQSNMQWLASKADTSKIIAELAKAGKSPPIREFEVTSVYAQLHPIEKATGEWKNGDFGQYSAIAFAFAHKLYEELNVPIGILNCSFSQTAIQAWVPRIGFKDAEDDYTKAIYQKILETDPTTPEHKAAWSKFYQDVESAIKENETLVQRGEPAKPISVKHPGNLNGNRDASWMFNGRLNPVVPYAIRGAIWNQGYANMGEGLPYYNNLHSLIRGWRLVWGQGDFPVYFHQFYCPGQKGERGNSPSVGSTAEMRLGTLWARDIPHANMACQIDVEGAIHYRNKAVPGQRLALHALKNQYGQKDIVVDGPIFKSYKLDGEKLLISFEHADGGLVVAETGSNALGKGEGATGFSNPKVIENGADQVKLFYVAGEDRVWHPATMKIEGDKVVVNSPTVKSPRGVSYGTGGVGFQPNLYNKALLPMAPFIYYDNKLVTSKTWPDEKLKIAGESIDPDTVGIKNEYRKMPLLSNQFTDNAVFQADMPVTIWGSAVHDWGHEAKGKAEIKFSFAGIEKTIPVTPGMREWQVTVPPMKASPEPKKLKVTFSIDGEVAHESVCSNIVIGDVLYVAAPIAQETNEDANGMVRVMTRKAKRMMAPRPSRFSVSTSTTPADGNRFASVWGNANGGFADALGNRIHAKTGKPVGIIYMSGDPLEVKHWMSVPSLKQTPSLSDDYKQLAALEPGNPDYNANARRYIADWKKLWSDYVPQMMATKAVPDGSKWGSYPALASSITTDATQSYNVMVNPFWPGSFKGIVFLCSETMFKKDQGLNYGPELSALANGWKEKFACPDPRFFFTIPSKELAPKITKPEQIKGQSSAYEISRWMTINKKGGVDSDALGKLQAGLIERILGTVYP